MLMAAGDQPVAPPLVDLYVAPARDDGSGADAVRIGFGLARDARRAGLHAQLELAGRSPKGQLKHADRLGARYVAIIGGGGDVALKDMDSGEQHETAAANVIPTILRGSRLS
jgi:histidyl-tRNA synthetase